MLGLMKISSNKNLRDQSLNLTLIVGHLITAVSLCGMCAKFIAQNLVCVWVLPMKVYLK